MQPAACRQPPTSPASPRREPRQPPLSDRVRGQDASVAHDSSAVESAVCYIRGRRPKRMFTACADESEVRDAYIAQTSGTVAI